VEAATSDLNSGRKGCEPKQNRETGGASEAQPRGADGPRARARMQERESGGRR